MIPQRRRRVAVFVAVMAGSSSAVTSLVRHFDHPGVQAPWHRVADIGAAVMIVIAIVTLVFASVTACRRP